ncbi:hypothetical protein L5515_015649 [Caenorhabditis briggsae]|uniref:Uncharacterized protein n=1 Tax=Caenorhabditis briggsae TaxID=6238 RepID=A0AAE9J9J6_CAEBR|nr:hypothetical protein L5515_015649 [Caenorhabditis briggsae]
MESQKKREAPIQVNYVSSSDESWRSDLKNETTKVRSLYPRPQSDPLSLQAILDGSEVEDYKENERFEVRNVEVRYKRKRGPLEEDQYQQKPKKIRRKDLENAKIEETPITEKKQRTRFWAKKNGSEIQTTICTQRLVAINQYQKSPVSCHSFLPIHQFSTHQNLLPGFLQTFEKPISHYLFSFYPLLLSYDLSYPSEISQKIPV